MDIKDLIAHLNETDPHLYEALISIIDRSDSAINGIDDINAGLKNPDFGFGHSHVPKAARIWRSTDQSVASGAAGAPVVFDTVIFDNDAMWSATLPNVLTIKTPGRYMVGGCVFWEAAAGGTRSLSIRRNGATSIVREKFTIPNIAADNCALACSTYFQFGRFDTIDMVIAQTAGGPILANSFADYTMIMWAVLLERARNASIGSENFVPGDM